MLALIFALIAKQNQRELGGDVGTAQRDVTTFSTSAEIPFSLVHVKTISVLKQARASEETSTFRGFILFMSRFMPKVQFPHLFFFVFLFYFFCVFLPLCP